VGRFSFEPKINILPLDSGGPCCGGHGFGLHSGALAANEMGGSLIADSDGPGKGAKFTLELPMHTGQAN
jgi:signal transduction histidine kinase